MRSKARATDMVRRWLKIRELNVLSVLRVVGILISIFSPYFLTTNNLMGVFRSFSLIAIMSIGMMLVIITGGIDLSGASVRGLSSLVTALAFQHGFGQVPAVCAGLAVGLVVGCFNGFMITWIEL